jgi:hypothetical protein
MKVTQRFHGSLPEGQRATTLNLNPISLKQKLKKEHPLGRRIGVI